MAGARVEEVSGLGELAVELRVRRNQSAGALAELSSRVGSEVEAQAKRTAEGRTHRRGRGAVVAGDEASGGAGAGGRRDDGAARGDAALRGWRGRAFFGPARLLVW